MRICTTNDKWSRLLKQFIMWYFSEPIESTKASFSQPASRGTGTQKSKNNHSRVKHPGASSVLHATFIEDFYPSSRLERVVVVLTTLKPVSDIMPGMEDSRTYRTWYGITTPRHVFFALSV